MLQGRRNGKQWTELPVAERLAEYSVRTASGCLEWQRSTNLAGYGHLRVHGRLQVAHRARWELVNGPIPEGLYVLHRCDNPPCNEITHLFLGTNDDNMADKARKRRVRNGRTPTLDDETVRAIRRDWARGGITQPQLAERYHTTRPVVAMIVTHRTYRHLLRGS
jgi:hypothetical protein